MSFLKSDELTVNFDLGPPLSKELAKSELVCFGFAVGFNCLECVVVTELLDNCDSLSAHLGEHSNHFHLQASLVVSTCQEGVFCCTCLPKSESTLQSFLLQFMFCLDGIFDVNAQSPK